MQAGFSSARVRTELPMLERASISDLLVACMVTTQGLFERAATDTVVDVGWLKSDASQHSLRCRRGILIDELLGFAPQDLLDVALGIISDSLALQDRLQDWNTGHGCDLRLVARPQPLKTLQIPLSLRFAVVATRSTHLS